MSFKEIARIEENNDITIPIEEITEGMFLNLDKFAQALSKRILMQIISIRSLGFSTIELRLKDPSDKNRLEDILRKQLFVKSYSVQEETFFIIEIFRVPDRS